MIVFRYLAKEVFNNMLAVTGILLMILLSGRFIKYLAQAASGELSPDVLFEIMLYRIPGFLELILPLGLFLGILLGYGRLYLESEMVVLNACGISQKRLVAYAMGPALFTAASIALLSFWVSPGGAAEVVRVFDEQKSRSQLESLIVGRFQSHSGEGQRVSYTDRLEEDGTMGRVFLAEVTAEGTPVIITAEAGQKSRIGEIGQEYLVLQNGLRYEGVPGEAAYQETRFGGYGVRLDPPEVRSGVIKASAKPTAELLNSSDPVDIAQLHWRGSLPLLALVVTLLAVPLSRVNPRQGRYARMLPAILLYLLYLTLLSTVRSKIEDGRIDAGALYLVHLIFFGIALNLLFTGHYWRSLFDRLPTPALFGHNKAGRKKA